MSLNFHGICLAMDNTDYRHILTNKHQFYVGDTELTVEEIVNLFKVFGWTTIGLKGLYPHLTMGKLYSALACYSDRSAPLQDRNVSVTRIADPAEKWICQVTGTDQWDVWKRLPTLGESRKRFSKLL